MKHPRPLAAWSQYLAARTAAAGLTAFDVNANLRTAGVIGRVMHRLDHRHRARASRAIATAFPHWDPATIQHTSRASFEHFIRLAIEVIHVPRALTPDTWASRVRLRRLGPAVRLLNARRPVIVLTGHVGNWEMMGYLLAMLGYRLEAVARPIDNPLINRWLLGIRERQGLRIITKWNASDRMLQVLEEGGALGFIADQNAGEKGLFVPFFGRLASTYKSIGLLAIHREAPVICGYAHRLGPRFEYEVGVQDVIYPEDWRDRRDPLYYVTARYMRAIEQMVRMRPEQYLWMHRRWKSRPRHERQGKPMPASLRRNLEELPWMDENLMGRLQSKAEG